MAKWADYCIAAKQMDTNNVRIVKVRVFPDLGDGLGSPEVWLRSQVVTALENNKTFVTTPPSRNEPGKVVRGEDVHVVEINGTKYIRTDRNQTTSDNLGNLPDF